MLRSCWEFFVSSCKMSLMPQTLLDVQVLEEMQHYLVLSGMEKFQLITEASEIYFE